MHFGYAGSCLKSNIVRSGASSLQDFLSSGEDTDISDIFSDGLQDTDISDIFNDELQDTDISDIFNDDLFVSR